MWLAVEKSGITCYPKKHIIKGFQLFGICFFGYGASVVLAENLFFSLTKEMFSGFVHLLIWFVPECVGVPGQN